MSTRDFNPIQKAEAYIYKGKVTRVIDGDTIDVDLDLGFNIHYKQRFRLYGINAPEVRGIEKVAGKASKEALKQMIAGKSVLIRTYKDKKGKYGRYLAYIYSHDDKICINDEMIRQGHAVKYGA